MSNINIIQVILAAALSLATGGAALAQNLAPPAERPPQGFQGTQFVDSKGCIYIRAGVAGAVTWVPRVSRDRRQICGFEPSFPNGSGKAVKPATTAPQPVEIIAATPAAPEVSSSPPAARTTSASMATQVVTVQKTAQIGPQTRILPRHIFEAREQERQIKTPKGYRSAWNDGRLNLRRAEQTLTGQEQMRQVWTDTVPRRLITK